MVSARPANGTTIQCVQNTDAITRTSTTELVRWLEAYSDRWNTDDAFTVGGVGALGRIFNGNGRVVPPEELATLISTAPSFSGKKRERISLDFSDSGLGSSSYAKRLSGLLRVKTTGCRGDAYYLRSGDMMCSERVLPPFPPDRDVGRSGPMAIALGPMTMMLCSKEGQSASPASILSASVAFGLYRDEITELMARGATDADAAFRLYQYYWIARRDRAAAMQWLVKAAELGNDTARFNLAYEYFESGDRKQAGELMKSLIAKGFSGPDLRNYYGGSERG
jgi:hypothetical protein